MSKTSLPSHIALPWQVAARTAQAFNPSCKITPIHGNIKEDRFNVPWFKSFDIVLHALDNLNARPHVNKMCMAANVTLVESGTAGYLSHVTSFTGPYQMLVVCRVETRKPRGHLKRAWQLPDQGGMNWVL
ncbi:hypothetical protein M407DRAFT_110405 [Tulasnella calospora MUT 4182]|uniref:THIF-type NAD/FAD binding fold domain-containing protein n=1 Tax=Tulasnella calospora MUT 4182 TaxID=1051891 RepID=A0A0C3QCY2_9AGAM|nr:hypothetical protein M407DRAFT_110405 [Tulasnella calospora MUT 4182]